MLQEALVMELYLTASRPVYDCNLSQVETDGDDGSLKIEQQFVGPLRAMVASVMVLSMALVLHN